MNDDVKWIMVGFAAMAFALFGGLAVMDYSKYQCRIEAIKAGVEADKINTACGVK
jgi:hypothetical protein